MSSNNDNKEKITENEEKNVLNKDEIGDNTASESEKIEESDENLLEIIDGEIDYPEEKMSLADVVKSTFDLNDDISEDKVVEDADEEVVFVAPERIMNFVEDYLNNVEYEEQSLESTEFVPSQTMYFSTDMLDEAAQEIMAVSDDELDEEGEKRDIHGIVDKIFAEEAEKAVREELAEKNAEEPQEEEFDFGFEDATEVSEAETIKSTEYVEYEQLVKASNENADSEDTFGFDGAVETSAETESDDPFGFEDDEEEKADEDEAEESDDDQAENAEESVEEVEETAESAEIEKTEKSDAPDESDDGDVDLYELAEIAPSVMSDEDIVEENLDDSADEEDALPSEEESENELPAVFTQGRAALIADADDEPEAEETDDSEPEEESEVTEDDENIENDGDADPDEVYEEEATSSLTVHRHKDEEDSPADDDEYYDEYYDGENAASRKQSFFKRHSITAWAKKKTPSGWVKFAFKCLGVLVLLLCVAVVLYVNGLLDLIDYKAASDFEQYYNLSDTDYVSTSDEVYENPVYYNSSTTIEGFDESMIDISKDDVVNILLIGTDVRGGTYEDRGNTDSMILLSINTRDKNIKLTSFMRDMYVTIPGRGKNRLNAAYAYGGPQLLFDTLKENFDVDVDLYARVNFSNFRKIINKVGGIQIELTEAEARYMNKYSYKYNTDYVEAGLQTLDGAQALSYARCRKIDSDFNRTQRQRKVIIAFIDAVKDSNLTELNDLLNTLLPMIQTNVPKMQIVGFMVDALSYLNTEVETLNIPIKNSWQSAKINKMDVICPNFELNKTAIVAHIYSTYKLNVEDTVYQSFELPAEGTTKRKTTTTTAATTTTTTASTTESTEATTSTDDSSQSSTTKRTYWWENTTTHAPTTTTAASQQTTTSNQGVVYP